jgi:L-lactate dehydrogenase complex protein LldE
MTKPTAVQLFATCMIEAIRPQAGLAVVTLLEGLGLTVEYPEAQTCCGQPAFNAGAWADARHMARHTIDVLSHSPSPVVIPSGSCADMLIHHYVELTASDSVYGPKAQALAARTYEFTQFVVEVMGVTNFGSQYNGKVTYHPSCHLLRGLNNKTAPKALLSNLKQAEVVDLPGEEECCGFGGLFAVKMSDISGAMLNRKLDSIESTQAQTVVACDISCLLHIGGGLHRRGDSIDTRHIAEILVGPQ